MLFFLLSFLASLVFPNQERFVFGFRTAKAETKSTLCPRWPAGVRMLTCAALLFFLDDRGLHQLQSLIRRKCTAVCPCTFSSDRRKVLKPREHQNSSAELDLTDQVFLTLTKFGRCWPQSTKHPTRVGVCPCQSRWLLCSWPFSLLPAHQLQELNVHFLCSKFSFYTWPTCQYVGE